MPSLQVQPSYCSHPLSCGLGRGQQYQLLPTPGYHTESPWPIELLQASQVAALLARTFALGLSDPLQALGLWKGALTSY